MEINKSMLNELTPVQLLILKMALKKGEAESKEFMDNWNEYDDYNDCHGDYYDAE